MPDHEHPAAVPAGWTGRAETELRRAGHHSTVPRSTIIAAIGAEDRLVTADELIHRLRDAGRSIGAATVYRTLELLERLRLLRRIEIGDGVARYEPAMPDGEHHHHRYVLASDHVGPNLALTVGRTRGLRMADHTIHDGHEHTHGDHCDDHGALEIVSG